MPGVTPPSRPLWAEVSRTALLSNYRRLRREAQSSDAEIVCVIKADAYGHGAVTCFQWLSETGTRWFGVTSIAEALALQSAGRGFVNPLQRMLVFSGIYPGEAGHPDEADAAIASGVTPVLSSADQLMWLKEAALRAHRPPGSVTCHIEVDTGMARQGVRWNDAAATGAILAQLGPDSPLTVEGLMTHLASPEDKSPQTSQQIERFAKWVAQWAQRGLTPRILHCGNSTSIFEPKHIQALRSLAARYGAQLLLRPGIALYGYGVHAHAAGLTPVLAWKTRITSIRTLEAGEPVSYNATFRCTRRTRIALLPVGYADGYNRLLSNRGHVLVRGAGAPIAGRVTMDQTMVDVTGIAGVTAGDEVVLLGSQSGERITADDIATITGTISYEVLCGIGSRVPRLPVE